MYLCATIAIYSLWMDEAFGFHFDEWVYLFIPSLFVIGLSALITWAVCLIIELKNIAKARK